MAVPVDSPIKDLSGLQGKKIATELVGFTTRYLKSHKIDAVVEYSWGATEAKPPLLADAIVEVTETGASLAANNLRIIETILESETVVIANKAALQRQVEEDENREYRDAPQSGPPCGREGGAQDERAEGASSILS